MTLVHTTPVESAPTAYALKAPIAKLLQEDAARAAITPLIPAGVSYEQVVVEVYRAWTQNKEIADCTPASIIIAVSQAVQSGLQIGKTVHLVPVNVKVSKHGQTDEWEKRLQCWNDYKGDIELVLAAGGARHIEAHAIYANDTFSYEYGDSPFVKHSPALANRGALIGAYAVAWVNGTGTIKKIEVMAIDEIEAIRGKSKQWAKIKDCPPWYGVKTVLHRVCKTLPKNPRLKAVLDRMAREEAIMERGEELDVSEMVEVPDPSNVRSEAYDGPSAEEIE